MKKISKFILTLPILLGICLSGNAMKIMQEPEGIPVSDQTKEQNKNNQQIKKIGNEINTRAKYDNAVKLLDSDPEVALGELKILAENGNFDAAYMLGMIYRNGAYKQEKDLNRAVQYYEIAAKTDPLGEAALSLGVIYLKGEGLEKPEYRKGIDYLEKAGDKGNAQALYNLGVIYRDGKFNIPKDVKKASEYFETAMKCGSQEAFDAYQELKPQVTKTN